MPAIQSLTMVYDALNEDGTFSEGDPLTGKVTLALEKPTAIQSFFVKVKGDAQVRWTTRSGNHNHTHSARRRYFKLKHFFSEESATETVLPQGVHVYNFSFTLPSVSMPSSFRGTYGKIVYMLEAKLSRSWKVDKTVERVIVFHSKSFPNLQSLMLRQVAVKDKELGIFSSGKVHMEVTVDRTAYAPGETAMVVAKINNNSSSDMIPKVRLSQVIVYTASSSTKHENGTISKLVGHNIRPHSEEEVRWEVKIPINMQPAIKNCEIISVDYYLKVYLDISFAFDPEVTFPVIIIPRNLASVGQPAVSGIGWGQQNSDFHAGAASAPFYPPSPNRYQEVSGFKIRNKLLGMGWKITMLVLSSLALVLGTIILIFNVYSNRRKKVVCVLKSYTPRQDQGIPGSPVPSERAPLTEHAMRQPLSSPTMQRGEILIEWKDGTVTPLYEA
nr:arrestin domain-containing protein 3-like [Nerophis lumbriciformis]